MSGNSENISYNQVRSEIIDNSNNTVFENKISFIDNTGNFSVVHQLNAVLKEYSLNVYLKNAQKDSLIKTVTNLVCGDVFVICGQSNAVAAIDPPLGTPQNNSYSNQFCRSVGFCIDYALYNQNPIWEDCEFSRPSCIYWEKGFVGVWGIKLQNELTNQTGIPVCIVNGARSSSSIKYNFPSHSPSDTNILDITLPYDRLYKKLYSSGLHNAVKAIFWYQGESDGATPIDSAKKYLNSFTTLYNSWKSDYPALQRIFMVQITPGCGGNTNGLIADIQRKIPETLPDVLLMSGVGSDSTDRSYDGCHYSWNGYNKIADKLLPLVKKYIYNFQIFDNDILPPNVKKAYASSDSVICIEFDKDIAFENSLAINGDNVYLKDYFYGENYSDLELKAVSYSGNKIYLEFKSGIFLPEKITYLPNNYSFLSWYTGPWIFNSLNTIAAFSFYEFPVEEFEKPGFMENIKVYPNPCSGYLSLTTKFKTAYVNNITITDFSGRIILEEKSNKKNIKLNLTGLQNGVYFIKIVNPQGIYVKKLLLN